MKTVWALHGFLGLASDWNFLRTPLENKGYQLVAVDLYENISSFDDWPERFNEMVSQKQGEHYLLGYSLGGRLALHALFKDPELWAGSVFCSTHYGLSSDKEKEKRISNDEAWAEKFLNEDWSVLTQAWNSQSVFANEENLSIHLDRSEEQYDRARLEKMMSTWSLGNQRCFLEELEGVSSPLLWLTGSDDEKFTGLGRLANEKSSFVSHKVLASGHRFPWQCPSQFVEVVLNFVI